MNRQTEPIYPAKSDVPVRGGILQRKCACGQHAGGGECEECKKKQKVQRWRSQEAEPSEVPSIVHEVLRSSARPLDAGTRGFMEPRFGQDFSRVRIHTDGRAASSAQAVGALAYTVGRNVVFGSGQYAPETPRGRELLAHELTHVVQQSGAPEGGALTIDRSAGAEREANAMARSAVQGEPLAAPNTARQGVQRFPAPDRGRVPDFFGEPLPYREATEYLKCIEIMGKENQQYCEQEVLGIVSPVEELSGLEATTPGPVAEAASQAQKPQQGSQAQVPAPKPLSVERLRQAAVQLRNAMQGLGTDEESIYATLSGRMPEQIEEIRKTYEEMFKGRSLAEDLRDELTEGELRNLATLAPTAVPPKEADKAQELTPEQSADSVAAQLKAAVEYWLGTDEEAIFSALTGRTQTELAAIKAAYEKLTKRTLEADLEDELSGEDLVRARILLKQGFLDPEDQVWVATHGLGTDENLLFAGLESLAGDLPRTTAAIDAYQAKGYGDMLADIRDDLSGQELDRAMELLHGKTTSTGTCSSDQRSQGLAAISTAASMARNAISALGAAVAKGQLSGRVATALHNHFNPGQIKGGVTLKHAQTILDVFVVVRRELLSRNQVTCSTPTPMPCNGPEFCTETPDCSKYTYAWTCPTQGSVVRLCKAFFSCETDQATGLLHEFAHHAGTHDPAYSSDPKYKELQPLSDKSGKDSLDNADSYAQLAKELS